MSDPEVVVRLLAAIDERERLIPLEHDGIGQDGSWHTRQCGYRQGEWLEPCECDVPVELRRLCQSHRDIVEAWRRAKAELAEGVHPMFRDAALAAERALWNVLILLARGYGIEDGETT